MASRARALNVGDRQAVVRMLESDDPGKNAYALVRLMDTGAFDPEYAELKKSLLDEGVELREKGREAIGYMIGLHLGDPGQLAYFPGMSWSARLHEYDHFREDKRLGHPSFEFYATHPEVGVEMERRAYGIEMEMARKAGYDELVGRLEQLLKGEVRQRGGGNG